MTDTTAAWSAQGVRWWLVPLPLAVWAPSWWSPTLGRLLCPP